MDAADPTVRLYAVYLCDLCVQGKGGECHSPGCALWINRAPDLPLTGHPMVQPMEEFLAERAAHLAERAAQLAESMGRAAAVPQPSPAGDGEPVLPFVLSRPMITPRLRADLQARALNGAEKYGTVLRTYNGRVALVDAYQEALDLVMYLAQAVMERTGNRGLLDRAVEAALVISIVLEHRGL